MKWKQSIGDTDSEHITGVDKEGTTRQKGTFSGEDSHCTHCLCSHSSIANGHTDATCYFLPPTHTERKRKLKSAKR